MSAEFTVKDGRLVILKAAELFSQPRTALLSWHYSMDRSATRFLFVLPSAKAETEAPPPITVILNFAQSLPKK